MFWENKMMKATIILGGALLLCVLFFGCGKPLIEDKGAENMSKLEAETRNNIQYMIDTYGFSETELQGIDVNKLISDYQLRSMDYTPDEIRKILIDEGDMYVLDEKTILYYVFSANGRVLKNDDTEIACIAMYLNSGTHVQRTIFDLENRVYYVDDAQPHSLSEAQIGDLSQLPGKYNIAEWPQHTEGEEEPSTGNYRWKLIFQLADGEYAVYDGYTKDMTHLPNNFREVRDSLLSVIGK